MIEQITVEHVTFVSDRSFETVIRAFDEQVGTLEETGWPATRDQDDFERRVREVLGSSGFTLLDYRSRRVGQQARAPHAVFNVHDRQPADRYHDDTASH